MSAFSKLIPFAVLIAGVALFRATPTCADDSTSCARQNIAVVTDASWTVNTPGHRTLQAVVTTKNTGSWPPPLLGSQWIAHDKNAGNAGAPMPGGLYRYTYVFCVCQTLPGTQAVPTTLSLSAYADNLVYAATLNSHALTLTPPNSPGLTSITVPSGFFVPCDNVLQITVDNFAGGDGAGTSTGLDAAGTLTGFVRKAPPASTRYGSRCCPGKIFHEIPRNFDLMTPLPLPTPTATPMSRPHP